MILLFGGKTVTAQERPLTAMEKHYASLKRWMTDTASVRKEIEAEEHRLDRVFDWDEIGTRIFPQNWVNLSKTWQMTFARSAREKIIRSLSVYLLNSQSTVQRHALRWSDDEINGLRGKVFLGVLADQEWMDVQLRITGHSGEWKIYDIRSERFSMIKKYFHGLDSLFSEGYHPEYIHAAMMDLSVMNIDSFSGRSMEGFPLQWGWYKKDDRRIRKSGESFFIDDRDSNRYLQIRIREVPLVKPFAYNVHDYPVLNWAWRLRPRGEWESPSNSVMASLTVIFYQNWLGLPVTIRYVWHGRDARCTFYREKQWFVDRYTVVLRGPADRAEGWKTESVDLYGDYSRFFGEPPPVQTVAISLQLYGGESPDVSLELDVDDVSASRQGRILSCPP